jgi:succinate dehydrogenase / fumarate reductase flavoprotein subunit
VDAEHDAVKEAVDNVHPDHQAAAQHQRHKSVDHYHRELGKIIWDYCGMGRTAEGACRRRSTLIPELREEFWQNVRVLGRETRLNQELEKAGRLVDYFELGELMCIDALHRNESCGGHFREEYQTEDGEALRNDDEYTYVSAWQYTGDGSRPLLHKEPLTFETVKLATRSYK